MDFKMGKGLYEIYGTEAREMTIRMMEAANVASGISSGASVALKPNLVVAKPPESGATTHAGVLEGVIQYLQSHEISTISIMEGSWVGDRTESGFSVCGYDQIGYNYGVPLYDLKKDRYRKVDSDVGTIHISERILNTDYLINLPVLKGHCQTVMTCALKNLKGCISDADKRRFHALGLHQPIAVLASIIKPALTIVDSICGDLNFEEGGTPVQTSRMLLGFDPVQIDSYACHLMGISRSEVPYIELAEQYGAGSIAWDEKDITRLNRPTANSEYRVDNRLVARLTNNVDARSACSACFGTLVHALYRLEKEQHISATNKISIGQEFKNIPVDGVGIGSCCSRALHCVPGCPPAAADIVKLLGDLNKT
ncbi:MAG: DUF362 domain-containing protein [Eubacteriales bacterium]|nr:DUF362 domain-containing protein [Eubacteriales bacterium]